MKFFDKVLGKKRYSLVISGGGVRGFYALGVLKALEETNMVKEIDVIYGVSAGAILAAYRSAGYSADWIFERFSKVSVFGFKIINLPSKTSFLKSKFIHDIFLEDLPENFKDLKIPLSIGAADTKKAKYIVYKKGNLTTPLLASMSIPGVFPPVSFEGRTLMDGGLINNFPVDIAKKDHPKNRIIGIFLNKFVEDQETNSIIDILGLSYEILMSSREMEKFGLVDELLYKELNITILSNDKKKTKKIFDMGYKDGIERFK